MAGSGSCRANASRYALLVGAAIGLGLLAKYAAIYFLLCVAIDAWSDKQARAALGGGRGIAALAIALALIAPNLVWNATHHFATFAHTAENAGWKELPIHFTAGLAVLGLAIRRVRSDPLRGADLARVARAPSRL